MFEESNLLIKNSRLDFLPDGFCEYTIIRIRIPTGETKLLIIVNKNFLTNPFYVIPSVWNIKSNKFFAYVGPDVVSNFDFVFKN